MRPAISLASLVLVATFVAGQTTPMPKADAKLDEILSSWEKNMGEVKSMVADLVRSKLDKTFGSTEVFEGKAKFLRSSVPTHPSRATLDLKLKGRPEVFEKFIFTGAFLYEYRPGAKVIAVHELPPAKAGAVADDNIVGFIFGMKAADTKKRYQMTLSDDATYNYVTIQPRFDADKAEFSLARLALVKKTSMPAQFWFRAPNGDEVTWSIVNLENGAAIPVTEFAAPELPAGWKWERMKDAGPRVLRNTDGK